ncbi:capsid assembly protease [Gammaproteobacteria bacterium]
MRLSHLAARLYGVPLLIDPGKLEIVLSVLGQRIDWQVNQADTVDIPDISKISNLLPSPAIAVVPIHGSLVRRGLSGVDAASGLTSYGEISQALMDALANPAVSGILLDIDSSGGEVGGVFELARHIRQIDAIKPVWALVSESAFSAAYALACAASRVIVTPTAGVGSIGVIAWHVDQSGQDAREGLHYTAITAGAHKADFSLHQPLTPPAHAALQAEVDRIYDIFVAQVATLRGMDEGQIRATEAGLFFGPNAVTAGLADAVAGTTEALQQFSEFLQTQKDTPMLEENPPTPAVAVPKNEGTDQDLVDLARNAAHAEAQTIAELCQLAGCPERISAFLAHGATESQVRQALLAYRAEQPRIDSHIDPNASMGKNPMLAAVKRLNPKE